MAWMEELRANIIRPALTALSMNAGSAEQLLTGTLFVESNGEFFKQRNGPALGLFQIEPKTHKDIKIWLMNGFNMMMLPRILSACHLQTLPDDEALVYNLRYACMIARIVYHRVKPPLPPVNDARLLAQYHHDFYNAGGKADVDRNEFIFKKVIEQDIK